MYTFFDWPVADSQPISLLALALNLKKKKKKKKLWWFPVEAFLTTTRNFQTTIHRANERFVIIFPLVHNTKVYSFCCIVVYNCCLVMFTTFWKDIHHKWTEISDVCTFGHRLHLKKYNGTNLLTYKV